MQTYSLVKDDFRLQCSKAKHRPMVTFAVPVFNTDPKMLSDSLTSILACAERYGNYQIIVRDDGSTRPETIDVLRKFQSNTPMKVYTAEYNEGLIKARQFLLDHSEGEYQVLMDADDILMPFDLEASTRLLGKEFVSDYAPSVNIINSSGLIESLDGAFAPSEFAGFFKLCARHNGAVMRTNDMRRAGGYLDIPPDVADDVALLARLSQFGKHHVGDIRVLRMLHDANDHYNKQYKLEAQRGFVRNLASRHAEKFA